MLSDPAQTLSATPHARMDFDFTQYGTEAPEPDASCNVDDAEVVDVCTQFVDDAA